MTVGERFKKWIDDFAVSIKDRLRGWMISWLSLGIEAFFDVLGKSAAPKFKPIIEKIERETEIPPELKPLFDEMKSPQGQAAAMLFNSAGGALIGGALSRIIDYILRPLTYGLSFAPGFYIHDAGVLITLWRRGFITEDYLKQHLHWHGLGDDDIEQLKQVTLFYPSPGDLVRWQAREVFEPKMVAKYGLDDELEGIEREPFYKAGMTEEQITNSWRAHWEHTSYIQMTEMLRRGLITEEDFKDWFRLVEIVPFWRDNLLTISWEVPTRVDIRRFYDLKTIDETRLRELYTAQGYHGKDLDDYVLWTKIYVDLPDLLARWKNGWITLDDVRTSLIAAGMKPDAADTLIQTKVKAIEPASTAEGKELTKSEIYKGVKQGIITYDEGIDLLIDLNYSSDQAEYLLVTNVTVLAGSPEMYTDFKDITQKYRKAAGLEGKPVPYELKQAALELVRITKERDRLKEAVDQEQAKLIPDVVLPEEATKRLKELEVALHRAESELTRLKQHYEAQLAEYKHGG